MNLQEEIKEYIKEQITLGNLLLSQEKVDQFAEFVIDFLVKEISVSDLPIRVKNLSKNEWDTLIENFTKDNKFDDLLFKSFKLENRKLLKDKFAMWDQEQVERDWDNLFEKAFILERRLELKKKLKLLESDIKNNQDYYGQADYTTGSSEMPNIRQKRISYLKTLSIAASIILILIVWQPQHWSDKKIFEKYSIGSDTNLLSDVSEFNNKEIKDAIRGEEYYFEGYTHSENNQLLEGINLVQNKEYVLAKEVFDRVGVKKEDNLGLTLYFAIAQLNSGSCIEAINNLEYLKKSTKIKVYDDVDYYLALAYLEAGERKKAKTFFNSIASNQENKYQENAKAILEKLRWF